MPSLSIKQCSAELTNYYLAMVMQEAKMSMSEELPCVRDINMINHIRADVNATDEAIRLRLRSNAHRCLEPDPDRDCP